MDEKTSELQPHKGERFVLHPHRSLTPRGFLILMLAIGSVSFVTGLAFLMIGAWPVFGFFGLDVALIYLAFRLNFRAGRIYETVDVTPQMLKLTRIHPAGQQEIFDFNPFWVRVRLSNDHPDGRTSLRLAAQGREVLFAQFLTDDERRDLAEALSGALTEARGART
ncbi:MAG: DUF2244 domain-containing protein [Hyphomicrobium sp.]